MIGTISAGSVKDARVGPGSRRALRAQLLLTLALALALVLAAVTGGSARAAALGAALTKPELPVITQQPVSVIVESGQSASFEASATGSPTPTVQWEVSTNGGASWKARAGATSNRLTITGVLTSESGDQVRASFKNSATKVTSEAATLTVQNPPSVTAQPSAAVVQQGQNATFEASASGFPAPSVQWEVSPDGGASWSPVPGGTERRLTLTSVTAAQSGGEYRAAFSNAAGVATSAAATLTVRQPPVISRQPVSATVVVGHSTSFEAVASGSPVATVQWETSIDAGKTWKAIEGATEETLTITGVTAAQSGERYRALFSNLAGTATSEVATLVVAITHYDAVSWGQNSYGQLGNGGFAEGNSPIPVSGLEFVVGLAGGKHHSLAVLEDGRVFAWGSNAFGQLGDGEEGGFSALPLQVPGISGAKAVAAGDDNSFALLANGTVMAWGENEAGSLGDGKTAESEVPVQVKGLSGVTAIAAGGEHALALLANGTVMAWGEDEAGQLGNGKTNNSSVPVPVKGLSGVTAIAAGATHSLALLANGTVVAWGDNRFGELGNSSFAEGEHEGNFSDVPIPVSGISGVTAIAAGLHDGFALRGDGTVSAWGQDARGELGDGVIAPAQEVPTAVSGLTGATAIAAGGEHSLALLGNGQVVAWGEDAEGELGNGTVGEPSDVPVPVLGLGEAAGIAAGGSHDLAFGTPFPAVTAVSPNNGSVAGGTAVTITGANFVGTASVKFGATNAASFTVESETTISAVTPPGAIGVVNVTVGDAAGTSRVNAGDRYTYRLPPAIKKLSPKTGAPAGGTVVTITGTNFEGASAVAFGAASATSFTVKSPTTITATAPPGVGTVDAVVTTSVGTSAPVSGDRFGYVPAVDSVVANSGPITGGNTVTVSGAGFTPASTFKFATKKATAVECPTSTSCTMIVPAHPAGTVDVIATTGTLKSPVNPPGDQYTYG